MGSLYDRFRISKPKPAPSPLPLLGLGTHSLLEPDLAELVKMGVTRIRHSLDLHRWRDDPAYKDWTAHRLDVTADMGFQVLVVVHGEKRPFTPAALLELLDFLPRRFPRVEAWQVLNEEPLHESGSAAAQFHDRAHWTIKGANAQAKVVTISMDPASAWGREFLAFGGPIEALSIHVYKWTLADQMRRQVAEATATGRTVWVTEFGTGLNLIPGDLHHRWEDVQREELQAATEAARGAERAYIYQYQTDEAAQHSAGEWHGIVRPDRTWRPAAYWLANHLAVNQ